MASMRVDYVQRGLPGHMHAEQAKAPPPAPGQVGQSCCPAPPQLGTTLQLVRMLVGQGSLTLMVAYATQVRVGLDGELEGCKPALLAITISTSV